MKTIFLGFDFSMNKPAATIMFDGQTHFMAWPIKLTQQNVQKYIDAGVFVRARNWGSVAESGLPNSQIVLEHTKRSTELANLIIDDIFTYIKEILEANADELNFFVASEGLSYGSKGDAALNLATYKGVFLSILYTRLGERLKGLYTYPPITMKSVAGCAKKGQLSDKGKMIQAFINEKLSTQFKDAIVHGKLTAKTNYIDCVDDIVDSYWALKTMLVREKFIK